MSFSGEQRVLLADRAQKGPVLCYHLMKRVQDIGLSALVVLLLLWWLVPLVALLIKLDSRGPVFFLQKRNGLNGRIFRCVKFRSMEVNGESDIKPAEREDRRITRVGRILRDYYIDELPQFFNVFRGDMAIVGPRPHMVLENELYENQIPDYGVRYTVKPGITGMGQIHDHPVMSRLEKMKNRTYWDVLYVRRRSFGLDWRIMIRTVAVCFRLDRSFPGANLPSEGIAG